MPGFWGRSPATRTWRPYYLAAEAFWFPSNARSEAYGLVQVEAMASGCPVINTAIPHSGVPWVSRHEETGLTVPVDDPAAFAAAARRLLEEPGLRDRLAAGARARAIAEFDCDAMGSRSKELYSTVFGKSDTLKVLHLYSGNLFGGIEVGLDDHGPVAAFGPGDGVGVRAVLPRPVVGRPGRDRGFGSRSWSPSGSAGRGWSGGPAGGCDRFWRTAGPRWW